MKDLREQIYYTDDEIARNKKRIERDDMIKIVSVYEISSGKTPQLALNPLSHKR